MTITGGTAKYGGGLYGAGTLTLNDCTVTANKASDYGGGLYSEDANTTLNDCTFTDDSAGDSGGGFYNEEPHESTGPHNAKLTNCTFSGDSAGDGGALYNTAYDTMSLTLCTVNSNTATSGAGVYNLGTLTMNQCTVSNNTASDDGGGLDNDNDNAFLNDRTFADNSAYNGGGIYNLDRVGLQQSYSAQLVNCTVSGNAAVYGGGMYNSRAAELSLTFCTVSGNVDGDSGGGLYNLNAGNHGGFGARLIGTIIAQNKNSSNAADDINGGGLVTGTQNLIGTGGSGGLPSSGFGNQIGVANPGLAALGDYGGPTQTIALLPNSPAIGAGQGFTNVTTDQHGFPRSTMTPDVGAFQTQQGALVVDTTADGSNTPFGDLSLRGAVNLANTMSGAQTITFAPAVFSTHQTIGLTSGQLELDDTTGTETITGPAAGVTVNGDGSTRVYQIDPHVLASISSVTITGGGGTADRGGGLLNLGSENLTLTDCTITGNTASRNGGGLANYGVVTLNGCTISGNTATQNGGGLYGTNNSGAGTSSLINCTVSGNVADNGSGAGLINAGNGLMTLTDRTVSGNTAKTSGGLSNAGRAKLIDTIVAGNTNRSMRPSDIGGPSKVTGTFNLLGTGGSGGLQNKTQGNIVLVSLKRLRLAPLGSNGGLTQTMALLPGSAAIGKGVAVKGFTTDQRGVARPKGHVDIGAFQTRGLTIKRRRLMKLGIPDRPM